MPARPKVDLLQRRLLGWFSLHRRGLPWRRTRDPYAVLVSEVMLQQTQASRVVPHFERFLGRFPTAPHLAVAAPAEVITAWKGLGYNRRALALHAAAKRVVEHHGGVFPEHVEQLRALPGVGEYTARAVAAFAFEIDTAPVDVNIGRVLQRALAGRPTRGAALQALADEVLPRGRAHAWGSALMDLGATVCTARSPRCDECPVADLCAWRRRGGDDPAAVSRRPAGRPFRDTDRFHRGRLVDALRVGPVAAEAVPAAAQLGRGPRLEDIVRGLVDDGLAEWRDHVLTLPQGS